MKKFFIEIFAFYANAVCLIFLSQGSSSFLMADNLSFKVIIERNKLFFELSRKLQHFFFDSSAPLTVFSDFIEILRTAIMRNGVKIKSNETRYRVKVLQEEKNLQKRS